MKLEFAQKKYVKKKLIEKFKTFHKFYCNLNINTKDYQLLVKYLEKDFKRKLPEIPENPEEYLYNNIHTKSFWREKDTKPYQVISFIFFQLIKMMEDFC